MSSGVMTVEAAVAVEPKNDVAESKSCCSCWGRMWNYIKVNVPIVAKICACAALRFLTLLGVVAGSFAIHAAMASAMHSPFIALCGTLPLAFTLTAVATVVSNAVTHALGWDAYRMRVIGPVPFIYVL
jgi:hypothetical protein